MNGSRRLITVGLLAGLVASAVAFAGCVEGEDDTDEPGEALGDEERLGDEDETIGDDDEGDVVMVEGARTD